MSHQNTAGVMFDGGIDLWACAAVKGSNESEPIALDLRAAHDLNL